jgi:hypothetical protein
LGTVTKRWGRVVVVELRDAAVARKRLGANSLQPLRRCLRRQRRGLQRSRRAKRFRALHRGLISTLDTPDAATWRRGLLATQTHAIQTHTVRRARWVSAKRGRGEFRAQLADKMLCSLRGSDKDATHLWIILQHVHRSSEFAAGRCPSASAELCV